MTPRTRMNASSMPFRRRLLRYQSFGAPLEFGETRFPTVCFERRPMMFCLCSIRRICVILYPARPCGNSLGRQPFAPLLIVRLSHHPGRECLLRFLASCAQIGPPLARLTPLAAPNWSSTTQPAGPSHRRLLRALLSPLRLMAFCRFSPLLHAH